MPGKRDYTITPKVLAYMQAHPGLIATADDVSDAINLPRESVQRALSFMLKKGTLSSETRGQYVFTTEKKSSPGELVQGDLFEYVGKTKNGDKIARGPDDNIYVLSRL